MKDTDWKTLIHQGWAGIQNGRIVDRRLHNGVKPIFPEIRETDRIKMQQEIAELLTEKQELELEIAKLESEIEELDKDNDEFMRDNCRLEFRVRELESKQILTPKLKERIEEAILSEVCKVLKYVPND